MQLFLFMIGKLALAHPDMPTPIKMLNSFIGSHSMVQPKK
jgi:hypothetical protein